jgi:sarcosine oxidase
VYIWDLGKQESFYGFPCMNSASHDAMERSVKVAMHLMTTGEECAPADVKCVARPEEEAALRQLMIRRLPSLAGALAHATTCCYTTATDGHFLLDRHPDCDAVWLISPCSGHGFKFASVVGEICCDLVLHGYTHHDISLFTLRTDRL